MAPSEFGYHLMFIMRFDKVRTQFYLSYNLTGRLANDYFKKLNQLMLITAWFFFKHYSQKKFDIFSSATDEQTS